MSAPPQRAIGAGTRAPTAGQLALELPLELPAGPLLARDEPQVELALLEPLALAQDDEVVRPWDLSQQC